MLVNDLVLFNLATFFYVEESVHWMSFWVSDFQYTSVEYCSFDLNTN